LTRTGIHFAGKRSNFVTMRASNPDAPPAFAGGIIFLNLLRHRRRAKPIMRANREEAKA
jgi:hypothetical protein